MFQQNIEEFTISDDLTQLLGQEIIVAEHQHTPTLYAFAYRDIYDKKVEQKLLHFLIYGFPNLNYIFNTWICVPKLANVSNIKCLFDPSSGRNDRNISCIQIS